MNRDLRRRGRLSPAATERLRPLLAVGIAMLIGLAIGVRLQLAPATDALARPTPVDIGFAQHMSRHHDQAILLASLFMQNHPTTLNPLARGIIEAQMLELGQMRGWLSLWGESLAPASRSMDWMLAGSAPPDEALRAYLISCESTGSMPGMATRADLDRLVDATGPHRDDVFLELMLQHHGGGLPMLEFAAREAGLEPVRQLATRMLLAQRREVALMRLQRRALAAPQPAASSQR